MNKKYNPVAYLTRPITVWMYMPLGIFLCLCGHRCKVMTFFWIAFLYKINLICDVHYSVAENCNPWTKPRGKLFKCIHLAPIYISFYIFERKKEIPRLEVQKYGKRWTFVNKFLEGLNVKVFTFKSTPRRSGWLINLFLILKQLIL